MGRPYSQRARSSENQKAVSLKMGLDLADFLHFLYIFVSNKVDAVAFRRYYSFFIIITIIR